MASFGMDSSKNFKKSGMKISHLPGIQTLNPPTVCKYRWQTAMIAGKRKGGAARSPAVNVILSVCLLVCKLCARVYVTHLDTLGRRVLISEVR